MTVPDAYIASIVIAMFVTGVVLFIIQIRHRFKARKQWQGGTHLSVKK